jgi:hypothetical protein
MSKRQSVTFSDQAIEALRTEARHLGISVSDLLRRIVDRWKEKTHPVPYDQLPKRIRRSL